jgi:hypothetical protein
VRPVTAEQEPTQQEEKDVIEVNHVLVKSLLEEFKDVFPSDLPSGLPPKRDVDHKIELQDGKEPPTKAPYRMSPTELNELNKQLEDLTSKDSSNHPNHPSEHQFYLSRKRMEHKDSALITEHSTKLQSKTNTHYQELMNY